MADVDLAALSFFTGFDLPTLERVAAMADRVEVEAGAVITEQGDVGQEAYFVLDGEVQVLVSGSPVASVGAGSLLGEMALLDLKPRSATLCAATPVTMLAFDAKAFRKIVDDLPPEARAGLAERNERFRDENAAVRGDRPKRVTG